MSDFEEYYADHVANGPAYVVMAMAIGGDNRVHVFSSLEKAETWGDSLGDDYTLIYSTRVIDVPEFGNVPKESRQ